MPMKSLRHILPTAGAQIAFETADRSGSFTRAGAELGTIQATVSLAIKSLEEALGVAIFKRRHRKVELTEAGQRLHADVALGLGNIRKSTEELRTRLEASDRPSGECRAVASREPPRA